MRRRKCPLSDADRLLVRAARDSGRWTVALAVAAVAVAGAELLLPATIGRTVDAAVAGTHPARWLTISTGLIGVIAAGGIVTDLTAGNGAARATARLRHAMVRRVLALDLHAAARYRDGDLVSRIVGQIAQAGQAGPAAVSAATVLLPPLGSIVALALIDGWLAVAFMVGFLVLAGSLRSYASDLTDAATRYQRAQSEIASRLVEALTGARTIAAAGSAEREIRRVLQPLTALREHGNQTWEAVGRAAARGAAAAPLTQIAVLAVGGVTLAAGRLTPGELLAALQYATLGAGLGAVLPQVGRLARSRAASRRAAEVLAEPIRSYGDADLPVGPGRLELSAVTVRRTDRVVLDDVTLVLAAGTTTAVVGPSGAGKSTLAAVAGRLVDPDGGEVTLDGAPLRQLSRDALRRAVGHAFARPSLFGDTIADAIAAGVEPATAGAELPVSADRVPAVVRDAARAAHVDAAVERLPEGYRTRIADAPLSGGEAQRLGLARALRAERLLVLDDATSSLDTVTEYQVAQTLSAAADGRTRLVVTHRVATAARADLVAWLDAGRLRACAPHERLWRDTAYRSVFEAAEQP
jgi:ATP-binding cassette subfamily B protein